ncbi:hypothetical protein [Desertivirga brevis]|uniref:hypothetical protein n=1 Tax=Desertivirga brevis TaxID=2810310 RepID=UPI001A978116|nr:hypothetical protein [Pedobacter sp. SYSU D00873]
MKGTITKKQAPDNKGTCSFAYANVVGDEKPEYIFLNERSLSITRLDGTVVSASSFNTRSKKSLFLFKKNKFSSLFAALDNSVNDLFLFNEDGNLLQGFPVKGDGYTLAGPVNNYKPHYSISGVGNNFGLYKF